MLGRHPGRVPSQGEILADLFVRIGYPVLLTSKLPNRFLRLFDTIRSLVQNHGQTDIVLLMVFSGPGFVLADSASWIAKRLQKPLILWLHGGNLPCFGHRFPRWVQRVLRRGNVVVSPSSYLAEHFRTCGLSVRVIPNCLPVEHYAFRLRSRINPKLNTLS